MAGRTPNAFVSYDAASTTPPPTATGRPRSAGSSRCSTEAKNESASAWRMLASDDDTNTCSHRPRSEQLAHLRDHVPAREEAVEDDREAQRAEPEPAHADRRRQPAAVQAN